ncbi:MAG: LacI family transcriptional regulator [Tannerella sp.]|jgi:LacI family transcriptional regulator|nr:LacI family transcriptional regulator [Tannerella sp.]
MRASLKDIAEKLNVSTTTVSWVLSGQSDVRRIGAAVQEKVLKCAKEMNYQPNLIARSLNTGKTNTIGLIIPSITDFFFASVVKEIEVEAGKLGYTLMICTSQSDKERETKMLRMMRAKQVDGIIIAPTKLNHVEFEDFLKEGYPFVLFDRFFTNINTNYVLVDNENSSYRLVKHLTEQGRKKIALITTESHLQIIELRCEGYRRALKDAGLDADPNLYGWVEYMDSEKNITPALDKIFRTTPDVDGFFFVSHTLALGAFLYFHEKGINVNKYGLACIHEVSEFKILAPKINVAIMSVEGIGKNVVRILHDNIEHVNRYKKKKEYMCSKMILPCTLKLYE